MGDCLEIGERDWTACLSAAGTAEPPDLGADLAAEVISAGSAAVPGVRTPLFARRGYSEDATSRTHISRRCAAQKSVLISRTHEVAPGQSVLQLVDGLFVHEREGYFRGVPGVEPLGQK